MNDRVKHLAFYCFLAAALFLPPLEPLLRSIFTGNIWGVLYQVASLLIKYWVFSFAWRNLRSSNVIGGTIAEKVDAVIAFTDTLGVRLTSAWKALRKQPDQTPPSA